MDKETILVVAAHPDDEILGCGGIIAKYAKSHEIQIAILGEGIAARYTGKEEAHDEIQKLHNQTLVAEKILGVKHNPYFINFPDNQFDTIPLLDIAKQVESLILQTNPQTIYTHHSGDLNIDHRITFQAVLTAARPTEACPVKKIYSFEVPSSTEWSFGRLDSTFLPNVFEDISGQVNMKMEALKAYKDETREYPHPRSLEAIKIIAQRWGTVVGKKFAEPFELIRKVVD
ncbi:hypothetical protein ES703_100962 [subsurface metagenome]